MSIATRLVGAIVIGVGVALAFGGLATWRQPILPSLCGCEFDAAVHRYVTASSLSDEVAAALALIAGFVLFRRHHLGMPLFAVWLISLACLPWIGHFFSPWSDHVEPFIVIWTGAVGSLAAALIITHVYRSRRVRRLINSSAP
jgi:hypothetical protein